MAGGGGPGTVIIPWYATGLRADGLAAAVNEIAPVALRYGASSYAVYRSRDDLYKFQQLAALPGPHLVGTLLGGAGDGRVPRAAFELVSGARAVQLVGDHLARAARRPARDRRQRPRERPGQRHGRRAPRAAALPGRRWTSEARTQEAWRALHASDRGRRIAPFSGVLGYCASGAIVRPAPLSWSQ